PSRVPPLPLPLPPPPRSALRSLHRPASPELHPLSLHDALPILIAARISSLLSGRRSIGIWARAAMTGARRSLSCAISSASWPRLVQPSTPSVAWFTSGQAG